MCLGMVMPNNCPRSGATCVCDSFFCGTSKGVVVVWLVSAAPLWVFVRVCGLLGGASCARAVRRLCGLLGGASCARAVRRIESMSEHFATWHARLPHRLGEGRLAPQGASPGPPFHRGVALTCPGKERPTAAAAAAAAAAARPGYSRGLRKHALLRTRTHVGRVAHPARVASVSSSPHIKLGQHHTNADQHHIKIGQTRIKIGRQHGNIST